MKSTYEKVLTENNIIVKANQICKISGKTSVAIRNFTQKEKEKLIAMLGQSMLLHNNVLSIHRVIYDVTERITVHFSENTIVVTFTKSKTNSPTSKLFDVILRQLIDMNHDNESIDFIDIHNNKFISMTLVLDHTKTSYVLQVTDSHCENWQMTVASRSLRKDIGSPWDMVVSPLQIERFKEHIYDYSKSVIR